MQVLYKITATEWDVEVFLLLMNIVHGHSRQAPSSVNSDTLGKLSVLVDYYECQEITEVFVGLWVNKLSECLPTSYGRDCMIWLFVLWVFAYDELFETMTQLVIKESKGPLLTICLPFPPMLLSTTPASS